MGMGKKIAQNAKECKLAANLPREKGSPSNVMRLRANDGTHAALHYLHHIRSRTKVPTTMEPPEPLLECCISYASAFFVAVNAPNTKTPPSTALCIHHAAHAP